MEELDTLSEFFKIFGDATRLKILQVLLKNDKTVGELCELLDVTQSAVSHQLRILRDSRLVKMQKIGQNSLYSIADDHIKIILEYGLEHIREV